MAKQSGRPSARRYGSSIADDSLTAYAQAHGLDLRALYDAKARLKRKGLLRATPARLVACAQPAIIA